MNCEHKNRKYLYSYDDFWDGDSDDYYECLDCGIKFSEYVPR